MAIEREMQAYERELPRLLQQKLEGYFVLIHRAEVEENFLTQNEAMDAGYRRHGAGNFLVKRILGTDLDQYPNE